MYTVAVTRDFIANHYLIGGDWGSENSPHAHHYVAEVRIESDTLNQHGYLVDIVEIEAALDDIVTYFRDSMLNDKPEFAGLNPSIEHFSRILVEKLMPEITPPGKGVLTVKLWENETCWAAYRQSFA
ncbi:6-carboxytetrahydropterin synthase [Pseudohongiella sp. SYSU M77423]|uniref:6-pyruvoyl trahydropterin synthase family protein n=1 Tax=unclassified Pseudohongiella TaxID=2629611 RepID=UPI001F1FF026|nr:MULTISPECIES: 6-carboxytetrahydropterin synthase [unclassified Pseudohongiella]MDH7944312.1 6-carboxytetrahydropterin synthase [Pseudohongiella sp. SYSU M77423]MEC8860921.1 6-carboxytetrahydropterin synthase [Pseudomonadota bacterium]